MVSLSAATFVVAHTLYEPHIETLFILQLNTQQLERSSSYIRYRVSFIAGVRGKVVETVWFSSYLSKRVNYSTLQTQSLRIFLSISVCLLSV